MHTKLADWRKSHGLTQEVIAERAGVNACTVSRWEAGETAPSPEYLLKWAAAVRMPVAKVIPGMDAPTFPTNKKDARRLAEVDTRLLVAHVLLQKHDADYMPVESDAHADAALLADVVLAR
ncbi:hypothetical protein GCM10017562_21440 [Streptomyces roseofulvus]|uniref:helix-turn-helix domain-containing protein n=1 Tax=Streptomyces roseofulvus TaxID=33902 RepID=UPI0031F9A331